MAFFMFNSTAQSQSQSQPTIAFYYGEKPPVAELEQFDFAVVEPAHAPTPLPDTAGTQWLAYTSMGEIEPSRPYYSLIPSSWFKGTNTVWQSNLIDPANPEWGAFLLEHVFQPLWDQGYRGFFLDTMDSYQLISASQSERQRSEQGLIHIIKLIRQHFPDAQIVMNRGFELLASVHKYVDAVAFESLFQGWDQANQTYIDVPSADREWLLQQAQHIKKRYGLTIISIDYCAPTDKQCATETVRRIRELGFVAYVGDGLLRTLNLSSL